MIDDYINCKLTAMCGVMLNGNLIKANEPFLKLFFPEENPNNININALNIFTLITDRSFKNFVTSKLRLLNEIHKNTFSYKSTEIELYLEISFKIENFENKKIIIFSFWDITEYVKELTEHINYIKILENSIGKETEKLIKERDEAEEKNRKKSEFLAAMSHELRTPLNSILGFTELLIAETENTPELNEKLNFIYNEGKRLALLINDILDFSKMSDSKLKLSKEYFSVKDLANRIFNMFAFRCKDKNVEFTIYIQRTMPEFIEADIQRILQILINIIGNAIKFTPTGSITMSFNFDYKNVVWQIEITDTGIGIPEDKITAIFQPFEQVTETSKKIEGTGLGLAITLQLVKLMRGNLFVKSKVDVGTTFTIKIPTLFKNTNTSINYEDTALEVFKSTIFSTEMNGSAAASIPSDNKIFDKKNILAVDDNPQILKLIEVLCKKIGFNVIKAENGKEALRLLDKRQDFFVIFMDLMMPEMDGIEAIKKIRETEKLKNLVVIAVTAKNCTRDEVLMFGFDEYIRKPFKLQDLLDKLEVLKNAGKLKFEKTDKSTPAIEQKTKEIKTEPTEKTELNEPAAKTAVPQELSKDSEKKYFEKDDVLKELENAMWLEDVEIFKIVGEFLETVDERFVNLKKYYDSCDFANFKMEAHSLKGISGFINLKSVNEISMELELDAIKEIVKQPDYSAKLSEKIEMLKSYIKQLKTIYIEKAKEFGVECKLIKDTKPATAQQKKIKIFISEDDNITRRLLKNIFDKFKDIVEFTIFPCGEQLLEALKTTTDVDLIFTDIHMAGGMSGFELAKVLRETMNYKNNIIAMTGTSETDEFEQQAIDKYFNRWLLKPVSVAVIETIINDQQNK